MKNRAGAPEVPSRVFHFQAPIETAKLCGVEPKRYLREAALAALREEAIPLPNQLAQSGAS